MSGFPLHIFVVEENPDTDDRWLNASDKIEDHACKGVTTSVAVYTLDREVEVTADVVVRQAIPVTKK